MVFKALSLRKIIFLVTVHYSIGQLENHNGPQPLGEYQKLTTQFDGVTFEETITYLSLSHEDHATLPLTTCNDVANPIDFTFKFWFKMFDLDDSSDQQFLNFPGSVVCYIQGALTIICNTPDRQELLVTIDQFTNGMWYYFTLSVTSAGHAELNIFNRFGQLSTDSEEQFYFIQNQALNWQVCLGLCDNSKEFLTGFKGGIREVIGQNNFTTIQALQQTANQISKYQQDIKGYYRFAGQDNRMFLLEQFRELQTNINGWNFTEVNIGKDLIPIDMCPSTFRTKSLLTLTNNQNSIQSVSDAGFGKSLAIQKYAYTMSLTVFIQSNTAITKDYLEAQDNQNIVLVDGVFMLYMYAKNIARFHFYAKQNFYESQSSGFFVPYNQWITIQLQMTEFAGYQVVVLDEQGQVIISFQRKQNMNQQLPTSKYSLFSGLAGFVGKFAFVDQAYNLPKAYSQLLNPLIQVDFSQAPNMTTNSFSNIGSSGDLQFSQPIILTNVPYKIIDYGYQPSSLPKFDGISCNDRHGTIMLNSGYDSNFTFLTPNMPDWMSETSIQFWFKFNNFSVVNDQSIPTSTILTMQGGNKTDNYWTVFIKGGQLVVSPFGIYQLSNPSMIFQEFNKKNLDDIGWWHLSCNYQFLVETGCTLYNKKIEITKKVSLLTLSQFFFPKYSLQAVFGKSTRQGNPGISQLLLKDVRYWSRSVALSETQSTRFQQIDPIQANNLLIHFGLQNGLLTQQNFAEQNPAYTFTGSKPRLQNASVFSDFILKSQLQFDNDNQQLITVQNQVYHNVCPKYTYMKDGLCYSEPVSKLQLLIFPQWNTTEKQLDWFFTLEHSNLIKISLFNVLEAVWTSDDPSLQSLFNGQRYNFLIPSDLFIQENTYKVTAALTNAQKYSYASQTVEFTPNNCHWFEVGISDAFSGYEQIPYNPGDKDFYFQLVLVQNPSFDCQNFNFYDSFNSIDFKFLIAGDDGTYIVDQPIPNYSLNVDTNSADNRTSSNDSSSSNTDSDQRIYVTLPALEQLKIPAWTDVKIVMQLSWTSSLFSNYITQQSVFQNAMFTIQFNPQGNYLIPQIQQNYDYVLFGQTFILTTQNTTISSLYPSLISNMLTYEWICPKELALLCQGQTNDTFYVPWNSLSTVPLTFSKQYTFGVQITWNKPDGIQDIKNLTVQVVWYNYPQPKFVINASLPILITNTQPTYFTIVGQNFIAAQLSAFNVTWSILPNLVNQSAIQIINQGQQLVVSPGNWAQQTTYTVTAQMVFPLQPSVNGSFSLTFSTSTFPQNGSVTISPEYGYIGDTFTVVVANFTDLNQPVTYNVFTSNDSLGLIPNIQLTNASLPQSNKINKYKFKFQASDSNPIIVVVQNLIGEQVKFILTPWIVPLPAKICTNVSTCANSTDNSTQNNTNSSTNSSGQRLLSTKLLGSSSKQTNQTVTNSTNNTSLNNSTNSSQQVPLCQIVTTCIQPQFNFTRPVQNDTSNSSSLDINSTNQTTNVTNLNSTDQNQSNSSVNSSNNSLQSTNFKSIPSATTQKSSTNKANSTSSKNQTAQKNSSRGLQDTSSQLQDTLDQILKYNPDVTKACNQINTEISHQISQSNLESYLEAFDQLVTKYDSAICILESLSTFSQNQTGTDNYEKLMEHLIGYSPMDTNYDGKQISVISVPFNSKTSQLVEMNIFSSSYLFDAHDIYSQLPDQPKYDFYMQSMGIKNLDGSIDVYLRVVDSVSLQAFDMSELGGQIEIKFGIIQNQFVSGQSLCQAKLRQGWTSDVCQTQIEIEKKDALCRCSMTQGATMVSLKNDKSQKIGSPILFPSEPFIPEFKGISLFFVATITIISLVGVISPLIVWRQDRKDQAEIQSLPAWKLDLIKTVALKLDQPVQYVKLRQSDIITAYVFNRSSSIFEVMYKIHPLFAPFNTSIAQQSRLLRFNAYYIQVNIFAIGCMIYFGPSYRQGDLLRQQLFLDSVDVGSISSAATIGSILLLPILSSPIQYCLQDKVNPTSGVVTIRCKIIKNLLMTSINLGMNTFVVFIAIWMAQSIPTANQYLISSSIFCGVFLSVFVTNVIRVLVNSFLPNSFLSAQVTKQLVKDLNAIRDLYLTKMRTVSVETSNEIEVKGINPFDQMDESSRRKLSTSIDNVGNDQQSLSFDKHLNKASKSII